MGFDRIRPLASSDHHWIDALVNLLVDGQGLRFANDSAFA
jgi:hypothetical protein